MRDTRQARIISGEPAAADAFEGGGHRRSAEALAATIEQLADRDGAVGLEGPWGSGKSTVIGLAGGLLRQEDRKSQYALFSFDFWAHQSDDFRRAFIEELIHWVRSERLLAAAQADAFLDRVRNRVKEVRTDSHRHYNWFGVAFILLAPFIPLALAWLTPAAVAPPPTSGGPVEVLGLPLWQLALGFFGVLYIALGCRLAHAWLTLTWRWWPIRIKPGATFTGSLSRAAGLLSRDVENETTTQHIHERDPTTVEFNGIFRDLIGKVQAQGVRVIIVLDNIDRLPKDMVPAAWSSARSLFASGGAATRDPHAHVTAVVPYDKRLILNAFEDDTPVPDGEVEADLIHKTFDRVVRVAPPIMTDWNSFLFGQLEAALGEAASDTDKRRIFELFRFQLEERKAQPTPRHINSYVNEIGALWSQWGDKIPLSLIALYVLHRSIIEKDPVAELQKTPLFNNPRWQRIVDMEDTHRLLAALAFNVDPARANQVLLGPSILNALKQPQPTALAALADLPGFESVLTHVMQTSCQNLAQEGAGILSNVAGNIAALRLGEAVAEVVWRQMASAITEVDFSDHGHVPDELALIAERQPGRFVREVSETLRDHILESLGDDKAEHFKVASDWYGIMGRLRAAIAANVSQEDAAAFVGGTKLPSSGSFSVGVAFAARSGPEAMPFSAFEDPTPDDEIAATLRDFAKSNPLVLARSLGQLDHVLGPSDWLPLLQAVDGHLRTESELDEEDRRGLVLACAALHARLTVNKDPKLGEAKQATGIMNTLVQDGTLIWQGFAASGDNDDEAIAAVHFLVINKMKSTEAPHPGDHPHHGSLASAAEWYDKSIRMAPESDAYDVAMADLHRQAPSLFTWLDMAVRHGADHDVFWRGIAAALASAEPPQFNRVTMMSRFDDVLEALDEATVARIPDLIAREASSLDGELAEEGISVIPNSFLEFVAQHAARPGYQDVLGVVDALVARVSQEDWTEALKAGDDRLRVLLARRAAGGRMPPTPAFKPAVFAHALSILRGEDLPGAMSGRWGEVVACLPKEVRRGLCDEIVTALRDSTITTGGAANFATLYLELCDDMTFERNADLIVERFLEKLLGEASEAGHGFLERHGAGLARCLHAASPEAHASFVTALETTEGTGDETKEEWAVLVRQTLRLPPRVTEAA